MCKHLPSLDFPSVQYAKNNNDQYKNPYSNKGKHPRGQGITIWITDWATTCVGVDAICTDIWTITWTGCTFINVGLTVFTSPSRLTQTSIILCKVLSSSHMLAWVGTVVFSCLIKLKKTTSFFYFITLNTNVILLVNIICFFFLYWSIQ